MNFIDPAAVIFGWRTKNTIEGGARILYVQSSGAQFVFCRLAFKKFASFVLSFSAGCAR